MRPRARMPCCRGCKRKIMPTLLETERAFAAALRSGDAAQCAGLLAARTVAPEDALQIYRNTFVSGAVRALSLSFPAVVRLTGDEFFSACAEQFVAASPPVSGCLDDYGAGFAEFVAGFEPLSALPYVADVAKLEWAVASALHAADMPVLDAAGFAAAPIAPERLILKPHPSLSLVRTQYPADAIWRAVLARDDAAMAAIDLTTGPVFLLVSRNADGVQVCRTTKAGFTFLSWLCAGASFADSFDAAPSEDIPLLFAESFVMGRFTGYGEIES